jgi:hypothetical protein
LFGFVCWVRLMTEAVGGSRTRAGTSGPLPRRRRSPGPRRRSWAAGTAADARTTGGRPPVSLLALSLLRERPISSSPRHARPAILLARCRERTWRSSRSSLGASGGWPCHGRLLRSRDRLGHIRKRDALGGRPSTMAAQECGRSFATGSLPGATTGSRPGTASTRGMRSYSSSDRREPVSAAGSGPNATSAASGSWRPRRWSTSARTDALAIATNPEFSRGIGQGYMRARGCAIHPRVPSCLSADRTEAGAAIGPV